MPRKAREKSKTGIYAVLIKGNDMSRKLFYDDDDYSEFITRLDNCLGESVMAFALCENQACMVVMESEKGIGLDIKPVTTGYARYYGKRYGQSGGIFERRFRSEPIETPKALAQQLACVHRLCGAAGNEGYTGRCTDDELFIPEKALSFLGSLDVYNEAMKAEDPITPFFAGKSLRGSGGTAKRVKANKAEPEKIPEIKPEKASAPEPEKMPAAVSKPKKKKKMPSWLL